MPEKLKTEKSIIIIGAGVVGAATALALQKDGHQVMLIDKIDLARVHPLVMPGQSWMGPAFPPPCPALLLT
jgi:glycine/D-amino acid oxidase-like deaminating enzyme